MLGEVLYSFVDELEKLAHVATALQPHQQRVVDKIQKKNQPGLVVAHGLGSGKTLTSIAAQEALHQKASVVVPASLQGNYKKEVKKHVTGESQKRNIVSMQNLAMKNKPPEDKMMIVDEAHRMRDPSSRTYEVLHKNKAEKRLLLTGSPFYNHPSDISPLVNIAAGTHVLPSGKEEFSKKYIFNHKTRPGFLDALRGIKPGSVEQLNKNKSNELRGIFSKWVDYYPGSKENFPSVTHEDVKVPMTQEQLKVYDTVMGHAPKWVASKIRSGLPPNKFEAKQLNAFLTGVRQISNTTSPFQPQNQAQDPKIRAAYANLKKYLDANPDAKATVYSNFLSAGIAPYKAMLEKDKIPYGEYTGEMTRQEKDDLIKQYNSNKIKTLLLSSAGGEGLDLQGTRLMQILEPHWNNEKIRQVEGRGARFKSHADLPEKDRNVRVERYLATRSPRGLLEKLKLRKPGGSVDEYLSARANEKDKLINEFRNLLPTS